jgi:hypothetical protein
VFELSRGGDDLQAFVRETMKDADGALNDAARIVTQNAAKELRGQIRSRFGTSWRVWAAKGLSASVKATRVAEGWWRIRDKATYRRGRTEQVGLLWVFDNAPVVSSSRGKYVAVPIKGQAPIHPNGRRVMWPSEAQAAGWELEIVPIMGRNAKLVLGRRNSHEAWRPLWFLNPNTKMPKRLNLQALHDKHAATLDRVWGEQMDKRFDRQPRKAA